MKDEFVLVPGITLNAPEVAEWANERDKSLWMRRKWAVRENERDKSLRIHRKWVVRANERDKSLSFHRIWTKGGNEEQ